MTLPQRGTNLERAKRDAGAMRNPVVEIIRNRVLSDSVPGDRADHAKVGLCIEGGAMRGVVSAGMISAIEQLGLLPAFDVVVGCSAGAANGAYLVAGDGTFGASIYYEDINDRRFIDTRRAALGRPVVDLGFLVDHVMTRQKRLDAYAVIRSPIPLVTVASNVDTGESEPLQDYADRDDLLGCIRASSTMPILAGAPCLHRGRRFWDGSLTEPVPVETAVRLGCTHIVALLTRPAGVFRPPLSLLERIAVLPRVRRCSPALAGRFEHQDREYRALVERLEAADAGFPLAVRADPAAQSAGAAGPAAAAATQPCVCVIRPEGPLISNLERRQAALVEGARQGMSATLAALPALNRSRGQLQMYFTNPPDTPL